MKRHKRVETKEVRREVWIVRQFSSHSRGYCRQCGTEVEMVTADEAAQVLQITAAAVRAEISNGQAHLVGEFDATSRICLKSLFKL